VTAHARRLVILADGRSPITHGWVRCALDAGLDVHLISSSPVDEGTEFPVPVYEFPLGLAQLRRSVAGATRASPHLLAAIMRQGVHPASMAIDRWLRVPLALADVRRTRGRLSSLIGQLAPAAVHALRIPFEGVAAACAVPDGVPLAVSVWGNDFTLHAAGNRWLGRETRRAMKRTDLLFVDCARDLRLASARWGFEPENLHCWAPGNGGVDSQYFFPGPPRPETAAALGVPRGARVVVNPRGLRGYVRTREFLRALALVRAAVPETIAICLGIDAGTVASLAPPSVMSMLRCLPTVQHPMLGEIFRLAEISVSPSEHDGTPNTLIEAMACGCLPVAGDIESVREWVQPAMNGLLFNPRDPVSIAQAIINGLADEGLRLRAREVNPPIITGRANRRIVAEAVRDAYRRLLAPN
jgi:hypothetical protein